MFLVTVKKSLEGKWRLTEAFHRKSQSWIIPFKSGEPVSQSG